MTKAEFLMALEGFRSSPERHYVIDGRMPSSESELHEMAHSSGIDISPVESTHGPEEPVITAAEADSKPSPTAKPAQRPAASKKATGSKKAVAKANSVKASDLKPAPDQPLSSNMAAEAESERPAVRSSDSIPENLGTLSYSELKALAANLGVSPVPTAQGDLVAAIEAKRIEGA